VIVLSVGGEAVVGDEPQMTSWGVEEEVVCDQVEGLDEAGEEPLRQP